MTPCRMGVMRILPISFVAALTLCHCAVPAQAGLDLRRVRYDFQERILRDAERSLPRQSDLSEAAAATAFFSPGRTDRAFRVPPAVAFLMSAAIPGTGQLVEGRNRAFAYLGLEAMSWIGHYSWKDAGVKKEEEYKRFADHHWSRDAWHSRIDDTSCQAPFPAGLNPAAADSTLEGFLRARNYQHYYEDIGKLEVYRAGWDDFDCSTQTPAMSANRVAYRGMRAKSNDYLNRAQSMITVAFLNRIVSAVDAYRTARGAHLRLRGAELKLGMGGSLAHPSATLSLARQF